MTHNYSKIEKYLFLGISSCIFAPCTGGPGESSCQEGSEYVWQRGVGSREGVSQAEKRPLKVDIIRPEKAVFTRVFFLLLID